MEGATRGVGAGPRAAGGARRAARRAHLAGSPTHAEGWDDDQSARWLMAQLIDYHRREAKPAWWAYFERLEADEEQLTEVDNEALGRLTVAGIAPAPLPPPSRSLIHTLRFPAQEHKIAPGHFVDPATEKGVTVESIDNATGTLRISRAATRVGEPLPRALIPGGPYDTRVQHAALRRFAEDIVVRELDAQGRYNALRQILRVQTPSTSACSRDEALQVGAFDLDRAKQIAEGLDGSYLFIQGPPGSGKTYTGAHLILHLIEQGHRVGVASGSHAAIHNLLAEVEKYAPAGRAVRGAEEVQRRGQSLSVRARADRATPRTSPTSAAAATSSSPAPPGCSAARSWTGPLDYLFIDEAGQISLADALAMGTCARNVILLGRPSAAGAGFPGGAPAGSRRVRAWSTCSSSTRRSRRSAACSSIRPEGCTRTSASSSRRRSTRTGWSRSADCANQRIEAPGKLTGTGIRYVPVAHEGNTRESPEEAKAIKGLIEDLLEGDYTKQDGTRGPLAPDEIMVVAPYNAQVRCLREALPDGVRVGTVDKFQGQEAAVCFFSMATSSGEEIPRHLEFLFSRNRLNVAISRARCLAVLVCNPELLQIRCRNAEQMRLLNALCLFVEMTGERV